MCAADPVLYAVLRVTLLVLGKSVPVVALEAVLVCGGQGASITICYSGPERQKSNKRATSECPQHTAFKVEVGVL